VIKIDVRSFKCNPSFKSDCTRDSGQWTVICLRVPLKARVETSTTDTEDVTLRGPPWLPRPSSCRGGDDPAGDLAVSIACACSLIVLYIDVEKRRGVTLSKCHWRINEASETWNDGSQRSAADGLRNEIDRFLQVIIAKGNYRCC